MSAEKYYDTLQVTGSVNKEVISDKFTSPENEKRHLDGVYLNISAQQGNTVNIYLEREKLANINDYVIPTTAGNESNFFPLDLDLPIGQSLTLSVVSGGTANNLNAVLRYTVS